MRACGFDFDEQLVPWADEFRESLERNLRTPPAERFTRALDRYAEAGLAGAPRRILGELEAAGVRRLLSKLKGSSDVKTPAGLLRIVVRPHGTRGFDRDLRRVSDRGHLGAGPYDLVPLTPKIEERHAEGSSGWPAEDSGRS